MLISTFKGVDGETNNSKSLEYLTRGGFVHKTGSGLYSFTPVGLRVLQKTMGLVRNHMNLVGGQEVLLPTLQPAELWRETGRWDVYKGTMFTLKDGEGKEYCLAPTAEEAMSDMVRTQITSPKQLPAMLYQFGLKYRDETVRSGLLRTREFWMKDGYSFHMDAKNMAEYYQVVRAAYVQIFRALGIDFRAVAADPGEMGGGGSEEFMARSALGNDQFWFCSENSCLFGAYLDKKPDACPSCGNAVVKAPGVEIGHIFQLGTRYSQQMGLTVDGGDSRPVTMQMGCYGIGVGRIMQVVIDQHHDGRGPIWPEVIAPFTDVIIPTNMRDQTLVAAAERVYSALLLHKDPLLDNRLDITAGEKFAVADLLGVPRKVIIGPRSFAQGNIEIELRTGKKSTIGLEDFIAACSMEAHPAVV
jgi:prolyl-tRNA synthetase